LTFGCIKMLIDYRQKKYGSRYRATEAPYEI